MHYLKVFASSLLLILFFSTINAQVKFSVKNEAGKISKGSKIQSVKCSGTVKATDIKSDWGISFQKMQSNYHATTVPADVFIGMKNMAAARRQNPVRNINSSIKTNGRKLTEAPSVFRSFRGNVRDNSVPMDNTMAVSKNGFIVSAINSNIIFTQPDGKVTYQKSLYDFFTLLSLGTRMYDPRTIYDPVSNRFILMCLHGSDFASSYLCIAATKTEDPNGEWNYYKIKGNPLGDNFWFDYPNIGLSDEDFYLAGLMRDENSDWNYSILFQIEKASLYAGEDINYKFYSDIFDADGNKSFNLVPAISGWNTLTSGSMAMVSNNALGGDTYNLYYTDGKLSDTTKLYSVQVKGLQTSLAPNARQPNSDQVLNTFDSRIWSAMYVNGIVHFGGHANSENGDVGIFYGRYDVLTNKVDVTFLSEEGKDFAFPSFAPFGQNAEDSVVLVNYLSSGLSEFASQQVRTCSGTGSNFEWSPPSYIKKGNSVINVLQGNEERWGDYTTVGRRFFNGLPEVWTTGCFAEGSSYGTWLGQIVPSEDSLGNQFVDIIADKTTTQIDSSILFSILSKDSDYTVKWTFEDGMPSQSTSDNPVVHWSANGTYDVSASVTYSDGTIRDVIKSKYIHISDPVLAPVANFSISADTIYVADSVQYYNASSDNAKVFKWNFIQGTPTSSIEENPIVKYNKAGSFLASLTVSNIAGNNTKIVPKAITVLNRSQPQTAFTADKTDIKIGESVQFTDQSQGGISNYQWFFEGGMPDASTEKSPQVQYQNDGSYSVKLITSNSVGVDSLVKDAYINVGVSAVKDDTAPLSIQIFPNPIHQGYVQLSMLNSQRGWVKVILINSIGQHLVALYDDFLGVGKYQLNFNADQLAAGVYYVRVIGANASTYSIPFEKL
ncbi:MAG: PKD domain-containing protein [Saprospiraceae bacterium]